MSVRLNEINIKHIKNVKNGTISMSGSQNDEMQEADVVGVYGQNGSGKTAIIDSLNILKSALAGRSLNSKFTTLISVGEEEAQLEFSFLVKTKGNSYNVDYSFALQRPEANEAFSGPKIINEKLKIRNLLPNKGNEFTLVNTETDKDSFAEAFSPSRTFNELVKRNTSVEQKQVALSQLLQKNSCFERSLSFVFSFSFIQLLKAKPDYSVYGELLEAIKRFGLVNMFVVDKEDTNDIFFCVNCRVEEEGELDFVQEVRIDAENPVLSADIYKAFSKSIQKANLLLKSLIPELQISLDNPIDIVMENGKPGVRFQMVFIHNGIKVPYSCESNGIRKIVSILGCLISVYNNPDVFASIDELDSGVYEYLLGQILTVVQKFGKGQLLFTSHNLRPLEILGEKAIYFTTLDSQNRYQKYGYTKKEMNFRNVYLRTVNGIPEDKGFYLPTREGDIRYALHLSGE